eukprot:IDg23929t1
MKPIGRAVRTGALGSSVLLISLKAAHATRREAVDKRSRTGPFSNASVVPAASIRKPPMGALPCVLWETSVPALMRRLLLEQDLVSVTEREGDIISRVTGRRGKADSESRPHGSAWWWRLAIPFASGARHQSGNGPSACASEDSAATTRKSPMGALPCVPSIISVPAPISQARKRASAWDECSREKEGEGGSGPLI